MIQRFTRRSWFKVPFLAGWFWLPPGSYMQSIASPPAQLVAAFQTLIGSSPVERTVERTDWPAGVPRAVELSPERLVRLGGNRFALMVMEVVKETFHAAPGAIGVAYVTHDAGQQWHLTHFWPEVALSGNFGVPMDTAEDWHFGKAPLYLARSSFCNMGECDESIVIIQLGNQGPTTLGAIAGGSQMVGDPSPDTTCISAQYTAAVGPPSDSQSLMTVVYEGWTAPAGKVAPKHRFHKRAEVRFSNGKLTIDPVFTLPAECGMAVLVK
jgi:hypothetical protein